MNPQQSAFNQSSPPPERPQPGMMVTESVRLRQLLARGGVAEVWVADHLTLQVPVAVKCLSPDVPVVRSQVVRRFCREARVGARLRSPHVVHIKDFVMRPATWDGWPFIVMELLEGEDLGMRIAREGRLSIPATTTIIRQLSIALEEAHALGIVHRDVKPENVFIHDLGGVGRATLLDFGVAKETDGGGNAAITLADARLGTPSYMSPEQLVAPRSVDGRADVWSLAVVAYVCLTGFVPFDRRTIVARCIGGPETGVEPPSRHRPELPHAVDALFARAFDPVLERRFVDATSFAEALCADTRTASDVEPDPLLGVSGGSYERFESSGDEALRTTQDREGAAAR
jgi:serine/threonine-protein kinase